ncbi:PA2169 family four-helix-bundle protein [Seonamhaeicola algicola]|uniref:PA2169 family four-helix-bundle protein n=1 Tax=Seonamhaeicola algicola TaxID=1719036 RepID=A0A5C7AT32_9FLAO|nr:PA2169 family four-helix-bundle protein [Seonamhaeicola algicola]TXE09665.1 PA2169 family four-helix-bundle protein [Seonamhaeicola algicola]
MEYRDKISNGLNELLLKNYHTQKGYLNAIENVEDDRLKLFFERCVADKNKFDTQLRHEIVNFGTKPQSTDSFAESLNRNWMNLKTLFSNNSELMVLEEAIKEEKSNLNTYDDFIKNTKLPKSTSNMLQAQKASIRNVIDTEQSYLKIIL